jgi:hypothetical protein
MNYPRGVGFYLWKLLHFKSKQHILDTLGAAQASWVCIKVTDGLNKYNQFNAQGEWTGKDDYLFDVIRYLVENKIQLGIWGWIYPLPTLSPGPQAANLGERYQKLNNNGLRPDFVFLDAEQNSSPTLKCYWKTLADGTPNPYRKQSATTFMNQLRPGGIPLSAVVALSSYRRPDLHSLFPFKQFVNHESSNAIAQQLYWEESHNPREQLLVSIEKYNELVRQDMYPLPFIPIGSAYKTLTWAPTPMDFVQFLEACQTVGINSCGFWSLDAAANQPEWLRAIAGNVVEPPPPPPPPPPPDPEPIPGEFEMQVRADADPYLNIRQTPYGQDIGNIYPGEKVTVQDIGGPDAWIQIKSGPWAGKWVCVQNEDGRYLDPV